MGVDCEGCEVEVLPAVPWERVERAFGDCHDFRGFQADGNSKAEKLRPHCHSFHREHFEWATRHAPAAKYEDPSKAQGPATPMPRAKQAPLEWEDGLSPSLQSLRRKLAAYFRGKELIEYHGSRQFWIVAQTDHPSVVDAEHWLQLAATGFDATRNRGEPSPSVGADERRVRRQLEELVVRAAAKASFLLGMMLLREQAPARRMEAMRQFLQAAEHAEAACGRHAFGPWRWELWEGVHDPELAACQDVQLPWIARRAHRNFRALLKGKWPSKLFGADGTEQMVCGEMGNPVYVPPEHLLNEGVWDMQKE